MTAHPHTRSGPCRGARTFGLTIVSCVRCGALLPKATAWVEGASRVSASVPF